MAVRRNQFLPVKGINQLDWSILSEGSLVDHLLVQIFFHTVWSSADWVHPAARAFSAKKKTDQIKSTQKNKNNLRGPNARIFNDEHLIWRWETNISLISNRNDPETARFVIY